MRDNLIRYSSIIRLAALALLAFYIVQPPVGAYPTAINTGAAQGRDLDGLYLGIWVTPGLARGQTVRYNWLYVLTRPTRNRNFEPLRVRVRLLGVAGSVIAQTEVAVVGSNQSITIDFNRDEIDLPGEDSTGRLQTILETTVMGQAKSGDVLLKQDILESFIDSVEIIDNSSGRTTVGYTNPKSFQIISAGKNSLIGFIPGQTLQVSALHPDAPGEDGRKFKMLFAVTVLLADGRVVAQRDEITLDPGEFHSFKLKRDDLPLAGEPGTGRVQVRAQVIWKKLHLKQEFPTLVELPVLVEIVDDRTGKTTALISSKPKEIVVVGSK
ncbi:MAG: hypothetical protein MOB07_16165 [Acidobacteria bacterium]|nr:hypothetical protein [Acidobacteriota bacterium]